MMRCHDSARQSSDADMAAAKSARSDAACTCADIGTFGGFGRRFLSPTRTARDAAGHRDNADAIPGQYLHCCCDQTFVPVTDHLPPSMKIALPLKIIIADICLLVRVRVMAIRFR